MANINRKTFIYTGAGVLTVVIGYFIYDLIRGQKEFKKYGSLQDKNKTSNVSLDNLAVGETISNQAQQSNDAYPLKIGSFGAKVYVLQEALNTLGASLSVDGKFGENTYKAINNINSGFGTLNLLCKIDYGCTLSYNNWSDLIKKAEEKGFNTNQSWTNAKKTWIV